MMEKYRIDRCWGRRNYNSFLALIEITGARQGRLGILGLPNDEYCETGPVIGQNNKNE